MTILQGNDFVIHWAINKCIQDKPEDFSGAEIQLYLHHPKRPIPFTLEGNVISAYFTGNSLIPGVYTLELVWFKNGKNCARVVEQDMFAISNDPEVAGTTCEINAMSYSIGIGYDGLSAYEIAVKNGFQGSETEWLVSIGNEPVQTTGQSTTKVMSQKATSDELDAINRVLNARFPFKILSFSGGKIAEKGTAVSVTLNWSYDGAPSSQVLTNRQSGLNIPLDISDRTKTITGITVDTTFSLQANNLTATQSVSFYNCKYVGVVTNMPTTEAEVLALTKLPVSSSKSYTWNGSLDNQKVCYCYPKAFGALTSIKDGNGFEGLSGYTRTEVTVNSEAYYIYVSGSAIASNIKQTYS